MSGAFVAIVGPSGAGKDTLIAHVRERLAGDPAFLFVRRLVTRDANAFEDHDTIDAAAFDAGHATDSFALSWRAHGLGYALPIETRDAVAHGVVAVCNLSRGALPEARRRFPRVLVVHVTAPQEVIAQRLAARGRESVEAIRARLAREAARSDTLAADLVVQNDRPIEVTGGALLSFLDRLRQTVSA